MNLRSFALSWFLLCTGLVASGSAQFRGGPPDPQMLGRMMDRNGNGTVDPDEWREGSSLKAMLIEKGVDVNKPVPVNDIITKMQDPAFQEEMQRRRSSSFDPNRRDSGPGSSPFPQPGQTPQPGQPFPGASPSPVPGATTNSNQPQRTLGYMPPQRTPVSFKLPDQYKSRDTNNDGQIGLYEWPRTDLTNFRNLDRDHDGFLTPFELLKASDPKLSLSNVGQPIAQNRPGVPGSPQVASVSPTGGQFPPGMSPPGGGPPGSSPYGGSSNSPFGSRDNRGGGDAASEAFDRLDRDRDGVLNAEEWERSRTSKGLFDSAKLPMTAPIAKEAFMANYNKAVSIAGQPNR